MLPALRTGVRLFVFATPAAVAVLAVATDTPAVMVLIVVPGAVVAGVLRLEHREGTHPPGAAGAMPEEAARARARPAPLPDRALPVVDDVTVNRVQARLLRRSLEGTDVAPHRLWLHYVHHGGVVGALEAGAYLHELHHLPAVERDRLMLTAAVLLDARHPPFLPCTDELLGLGRTHRHPTDQQN